MVIEERREVGLDGPSPNTEGHVPSDRPPPFDLISGIARNEGAITTSFCLSRPLLPIVPLLHTMFFARRSVASLRPLLRNQQPRRLGSHAAHPAEPVNEGYGVCTLPHSFFLLPVVLRSFQLGA